MPAIVTQNFRNNQVTSFLDYITDSENHIYAFIGNPISWDVEESPPVPIDNDGSIFNYWDLMYGIKKVNNTGIKKVIRRRNWNSGEVFDNYETNMGPIPETNFYVMTSNFQVYKCIWNNNGAPSTVEPTGTSNDNIISTGDGYIWSYMYTVSTVDAQTFLTPEYIPIFNDATVQSNAADNKGKVYAVKVLNGGAGYLSVNFGGTPTRHALAYATVAGGIIQNIEVVDGGAGYTGSIPVSISGGNGTGAVFANISESGGSIPLGTYSPSNGGTGYSNAEVSILAGSGSNFVGMVLARQGIIRSIYVDDEGQDYTFLKLAVIGAGAGAEIDPVLTPFDGHGNNAELELGGTAIMFSARINTTELGDAIPDGNSYRNIGVIVNPFHTPDSSSELFTGEYATNMIKLEMTSTADIYLQNEVVTGGTSGAKGKVVFWNSSTNTLYLIQTIDEGYGIFENSETITGESSGKVAVVDSAPTFPTLNKYTGEILYIENRSPVNRNANQIEDIRIVIEF